VAQGANAKLTPEDIDHNLPIIREAGLVLTQLEIPLETVEHLSSVCARQGVPLVFDPAPARDLPARIFSKIAWFTPNETEAAFYAVNAIWKGKGILPRSPQRSWRRAAAVWFSRWDLVAFVSQRAINHLSFYLRSQSKLSTPLRPEIALTVHLPSDLCRAKTLAIARSLRPELQPSQ